MSEFKDWYNSVPFFTRYWLSFTVGLSLLAKFGLLNPFYLVLEYYTFIHQFQIWRPFTALFYYPITPATGFHFLINCYFLYNYSSRLETGMFLGKPADYFYMLLFNWACCVLTAMLVGLPFLMDPMVLSVLYVWCQLNKDVIVSFWFGTRFKAMYLPWVLLAFNLVINGGGVMELLGILIGHLSFFLVFKYPQEFGGPALLTPPLFLKQIFPDTRYMGGFGSAPTARATTTGGATTGRHNWGRGHTLGGN
ncbi:der1-like family domain-containing protein [Phthorimaea operculella]|nr:der1-like family domain-containing protein [Phthorimaea operculella]